MSTRPSTVPLGAGGVRLKACEDGVPTRHVGAALARRLPDPLGQAIGLARWLIWQ